MTPLAVTTLVPTMMVRGASAMVVPPAFTLWRRFWPVSLMMRRRSAAGLKSTPNDVASASSATGELIHQAGLAAGRVDVYTPPPLPTP